MLGHGVGSCRGYIGVDLGFRVWLYRGHIRVIGGFRVVGL